MLTFFQSHKSACFNLNCKLNIVFIALLISIKYNSYELKIYS